MSPFQRARSPAELARIRSPANRRNAKSIVDLVKIDQLGTAGTGAGERQARLLSPALFNRLDLPTLLRPREGDLTWAAGLRRKLAGPAALMIRLAGTASVSTTAFIFTFRIAWLRTPNRREP